MRSGSDRGPSGRQSAGVGDAIEQLYSAPLDRFVRLRKELVAALRASGDAKASRAVAEIAKPSRTAWALNQVSRNRPELVAAALEAYEAAQAAQKAGEGEAMRASARSYRDRVAKVIEVAGQLVRDDGSELAPTQGRRIGATLQAVASSGDMGLRNALSKGSLAADIDVDDPFAGLELASAGRRVNAAPATAPPTPSRGHVPDELAARRVRAKEEAAAREREERERQARTREQEAKRERVAALEAEAKEARASARQAEVVAARAQADAQRARRTVLAIENQLDQARRDLRATRP